MKPLFYTLLLIGLCLQITSCDNQEPMPEEASFSLTIDGVAFENGDPPTYGVLNVPYPNGEGFRITFYWGLDPTMPTDLMEIVLFIGKYYQGIIEAGDEFPGADIQFTGTTPKFVSQGVYIKPNNGVNSIYAESDSVPDACFVKITTIDRENSTISGSFTFKGIDEDTGIEYVIGDGRFENLDFD